MAITITRAYEAHCFQGREGHFPLAEERHIRHDQTRKRRDEAASEKRTTMRERERERASTWRGFAGNTGARARPGSSRSSVCKRPRRTCEKAPLLTSVAPPAILNTGKRRTGDGIEASRQPRRKAASIRRVVIVSSPISRARFYALVDKKRRGIGKIARRAIPLASLVG